MELRRQADFRHWRTIEVLSAAWGNKAKLDPGMLFPETLAALSTHAPPEVEDDADSMEAAFASMVQSVGKVGGVNPMGGATPGVLLDLF